MENNARWINTLVKYFALLKSKQLFFERLPHRLSSFDFSLILGTPFIRGVQQEFVDAWYDPHNPDQATLPPMTVTFETWREDFPPNIADLKIQHILLYFACTDGDVFDETVTLKFKAKGEANAVGGDAKPIDGVISTRRGNSGSWLAMTDEKSPAGLWTLSLRDSPEIRKLYTNEVIEDILLVITYSGRTPVWPN